MAGGTADKAIKRQNKHLEGHKMAKNDKAGKTAKQSKEKNNLFSKEKNKLFSIYGARQSNSGERVNISLLRGQDDEREWATITIKDSKGKKAKDGKVCAYIKDGYAYLRVPILNKEEAEAGDGVPF